MCSVKERGVGGIKMGEGGELSRRMSRDVISKMSEGETDSQKEAETPHKVRLSCLFTSSLSLPQFAVFFHSLTLSCFYLRSK